MSLAAETRRAADAHPFLIAALRAGVVNYTAAARFLAVDGDEEAIASALRRYAADLPAYDREERRATVRLESGVGPVDESDDALLAVGGLSLGEAGGDFTAIIATGEVDADALRSALDALAVDGVTPVAAGVGEETLAVVVERRAGASALRAVERGLEAVPVDS